jgi:PAS domain S-box-containing protein
VAARRPRDAPSVDHDGLVRFGTDTARVLGGSLEIEATLAQVADLAVPALADWCAIDLLEPSGQLTSVAVAHQDPALHDLVAELRRDFPADPASPVGVYAVVRERRTMTLRVTPEMVRNVARDARHAQLLETLDVADWMGVPLLSGERVLGTIALARTPARGPFGPAHVAAAETLGIRAAAALENARAFRTADRFRRILDAVSEAVFVVAGAHARLVHVNRGALDLLGQPPDRVVGGTLWSVIPDLDEDAVRSVVDGPADEGPDARILDVTVRPAVGPPVPVEILLQRVDLPREGRTVVAIARDIRERMDAQARLVRLAEAEHARAAELRAVIRAIGDGVLVCAADGRVVLGNPAAEALLGGVAPRTYDDLLARLVDPHGAAPSLDRPSEPVVLGCRDEPERWLEVATYPVTGDPGSDGRAETIVVLRDVTDARRRDAIRETFIGVLSHELRTPVTTIYGGAKLLARQDSTMDEATRRAVFEDLVAESERLQRLVEDVVAFNRFGESEGELPGQEPVLLQRIVPGVVASEAGRWPSAVFATDIPPGLPTVVADPVYVEQVVRNLLSNAAKYGGDAVRVTVSLTDGDGEVVTTIRDDGPGIQAGEQDRLFDLFFRSEATAKSAPGAGIGLFVCARLVRAMGGRIWARPADAGGAEFGFALRVMGDD